MARQFITCDTCKEATEHFVVYDAPHGISGAVMAGSERYKCANCGSTINPKEVKYRGVEVKENYRFLAEGAITASDIKRVIELTRNGRLSWHLSDGHYAFSGNPSSQQLRDDEKVCKAIVGENLRGLRLGFHPETKLWHYFRISDGDMNHHHVERDTDEELKGLVSQLYAQVAVQAAAREGVTL